MAKRNERPRGSSPKAPYGFSSLSPAKPTEVYETYWRFAAERQAIFFRRSRNEPSPWTTDPILAKYQFTNAYRASDRVSQFLIRHVIGEGGTSSRDLFFRILLFKLFNRIDTWLLLEKKCGPISYDTYSYQVFDSALTSAIESGAKIYSAAYIMPTGVGKKRYKRKHRFHLRLIEQMMEDQLPERLQESRSLLDAFTALREYPSIGDFLAFQYVIDLNYSTLINFSEMDFVVAGPGAKDGIRKCFSSLGGLNESEIIRVIADRQEEEFDRLGISFESLWGRPLQLIDCQNVFCEVDKYARVKHPAYSGRSGRTRIKRNFRPNSEAISYQYPPKWKINELMGKGVTGNQDRSSRQRRKEA